MVWHHGNVKTSADRAAGSAVAKAALATPTPSYTAKPSSETRKRASEPEPTSDGAKRSRMYTEFSWSPSQGASSNSTSGRAVTRSSSLSNLSSKDEVGAGVKTTSPAADTHAPNREAESNTAPVPDIQTVLWVPDAHGGGSWNDLSSSSDLFGSAIKTKFDADYRTTQEHTQNLKNMLRFRERYLQLDYCANVAVYRRTVDKNRWTAAGGDKTRACNACSKAGRFCARLVKVEDTIKLAIFPLPEQYARGKLSTEVAYWVKYYED
jgi:hypothetical protein